ncbi:MAG: hypothetical protein GY853_02220 [PVC group bacterium]|nr:hypothetical protein [PVC group bacterium]
MNPIIAQTIGYGVVFLLTIVFINLLSSNFLFTFLRVKSSRGQLMLVEIDGLTNTTYKIGKIDGNMLKFKSPAKKKKTILFTRDDVRRKLGVNSVTIDDESNSVRNSNYSSAPEFDAEQYDNLIVRAETAPVLEDKTDRIIMIVGLMIILVGLLYVGYQLSIIKTLVAALKTSGVIP